MLDAVSIARELIRCKSVTPDHDGAFNILSGYLSEIGFEVSVFECSGSDGNCVTNLYAKRGTQGPVLAFAGHVDVVPVGNMDRWTSDPFAADIKDGRMIGRGAADMKAAIACFLSATEKYLSEVDDFDGQIAFLLTGDEEEGSQQGMRSLLNWCVKNNRIPDYCILGEPSCNEKLGDAYLIGRRGSINGFVSSNGDQGHVAHPEFAVNAIKPLISYLNTLTSKKWDDGDGVFQPTHLELTSINVENYTRNVIPGSAEATFNIRFNRNYSGEGLDKVLKDMASLVSSHLEVTTSISGEPFTSNCEILNASIEAAISSATSIQPEQSTVGGTSDARFIVDYCPVIEFGMPYATIHKENEFVYTSDIEKLTMVYNLFLGNFFSRLQAVTDAETQY